MKSTAFIKRALAFVCCIVFLLAANSEEFPITDYTAQAAQTSAGMQSEIDETEKRINELRDKQAELDQKISETEGELSKEQENQNAIEEQIEIVQDTIYELEKSMDALSDNIDKLGAEITEASNNAEIKRKEIEKETEEFGQRLRIMYVTGNDSYTKLILSSGDFFDMLMKVELVKRVATHDAAVLDGLIEKKNSYEAEQAELEVKRAELQDQLEKLKEQKRLQNDQKQKLDELFSKSKEMIEKLEKDKEAFLADQDDNSARQEEFEAMLQKLKEEQEALRKAEEEERRRKEEEERKRQEEEKRKQEEEKKRQEEEAKKQQQQQQQQQQGGSSSSGNTQSNGSYGYTDKSMFTWPVPGFYYVSYGVGWRWGAYHQGIDIYSRNIRGASICAAAEGTVILVDNGCTHDYGKYSNCCRSGYGNYCIIDHGNGWWTLYGHSERMNVVVGQHVEKGQKLGTVGSTGYSTGPHLHFEIRRNGTAVNPSLYV